MAATVAAKPANVLSIFWQGQEAGLVFWDLGGAWRHHPWQVLEGGGGKENQPRTLPMKSPRATGAALQNSWSAAGGQRVRLAWWAGPAGRRALTRRWGEGSRMQVTVDAFSADTEQCVMLSARPGSLDPALSLFASELAGAGPMVTKQRTRSQCPGQAGKTP